MANNLSTSLLLCFDKAPEEAVKYLESLGIKITWDWQSELKAIKKLAFTVSKVTKADILQDVLDEIKKAVNEGIALEQFKTELSDTLKQKGYTKKEDGSAWRLDTIYRTNSQSIYSKGRFNQMSEVKNEFPYWRYVATLDSRTTQGCITINDIVLPADDPFWKTNYPPRHFNCRGRVVALNDALIKQYGYKVSDGNQYRNVKPAEGFDTYPGEWQPDLTKYDGIIKNGLKKELK